VEYKKTANNNVAVDLKVKHLAPPQRVAENANTYVVWAEPTVGDTKAVQNMGALKVNKDLEGTLSTVLPHPNFNLVVTAESSPMVSTPSDKTVLTTPLTRNAE
jgi:hypothetical protein